MKKTKAQRQRWFYGLTPNQQAKYIAGSNQRKAERRKRYPVKVRQRYYITLRTRLKWLKKIVGKNPWLLERSESIRNLLLRN